MNVSSGINRSFGEIEYLNAISSQLAINTIDDVIDYFLVQASENRPTKKNMYLRHLSEASFSQIHTLINLYVSATAQLENA